MFGRCRGGIFSAHVTDLSGAFSSPLPPLFTGGGDARELSISVDRRLLISIMTTSAPSVVPFDLQLNVVWPSSFRKSLWNVSKCASRLKCKKGGNKQNLACDLKS